MVTIAREDNERYAALWDPVCCKYCGDTIAVARPVRSRERIRWRCRCGMMFDLKDKAAT
jgi:hypothetical protein